MEKPSLHSLLFRAELKSLGGGKRWNTLVFLVVIDFLALCSAWALVNKSSRFWKQKWTTITSSCSLRLCQEVLAASMWNGKFKDYLKTLVFESQYME